MKRRRLIFGLVIALIIMAIVACGEAASPTKEATLVPTPTPPPPAETPIPPTPTPVLSPTPTNTRVVPIATATHTPTLVPKPETYGEFSLVLFERAETFALKAKFFPPWRLLSRALEPQEGIDIALVVVRLTNTGERWILPQAMPGWLVDTLGERYQESFDFLIDEQGDPSGPNAIVLYSERGPLVLTDGLAYEEIGPNESLLMGSIIRVPQGRETTSFILRYQVWETAMPLGGEEWDMEAMVPVGE